MAESQSIVGEVDPVGRQECGEPKTRAASPQVKTALGAVAPVVDDFMRHDEVVLGLHCTLHFVAHYPGAARPLVATERASRSVSEIC